MKRMKVRATPKNPSTVLDYCVRALGQRRGGLAAAHVAQWAIATHELGHVPTTVEYADYWYCDERTGWRHRASCAAVFGDEWQAVVESLAADIGDRLSPRAVAKRLVAAFA